MYVLGTIMSGTILVDNAWLNLNLMPLNEWPIFRANLPGHLPDYIYVVVHFFSCIHPHVLLNWSLSYHHHWTLLSVGVLTSVIGRQTHC